MQRIDFISNAILIKSRKRYEKSKYANMHTVGKPFNDTDYIFEGLFRTNNDFVLSKNNEYFTVPASTQNIQTNPSNNEKQKQIYLFQLFLTQIQYGNLN